MTRLANPAPEYPSAAKPIRLAKARSALIVYRQDDFTTRFLLISSRSRYDKLTLPGGKVGKHEAAVEAAIRETAEEAGVLTDTPQPVGQYLHRKSKAGLHPTQTFVAPFVGQLHEFEPRQLHWLTLEQIVATAYTVRRPIREQVELAADFLRHASVAA